jgi:uncharacterized membrane protein YtjA (UPF0391 family)
VALSPRADLGGSGGVHRIRFALRLGWLFDRRLALRLGRFLGFGLQSGAASSFAPILVVITVTIFVLTIVAALSLSLFFRIFVGHGVLSRYNILSYALLLTIQIPTWH